MARTLPWLGGTTSKQATKSPPSRRPMEDRPLKRQRRETPKDADEGSISTSRRPKGRNASSSPPPAPPAEESMQPSDAAWIMVEDELHEVAQQFTKHLHHEEYKRQQREAAERNKLSATLIRPVDGRAQLSIDTRIANRAESHRKELVEAGVPAPPRSGGCSDANEDDIMEDPEEGFAIADRNLAGLMRGLGGGSIPERVMLDTSQRPSATRAAAGYEKQPSSITKAQLRGNKVYDIPGADNGPGATGGKLNTATEHDSTASEDDGDLDVPIPAPSPQQKSSGPSPLGTDRRATQCQPIPPRLPVPFIEREHKSTPHFGKGLTRKPAPSTSAAPTEMKPNSTPHTPDLSLDDFPRARAPISVLANRSKLKKQNGDERRKREVIKLEEIPTFLF